MGTTMPNSDAVLKDFYHGPVTDQLSNATVGLSHIEETSDNVDFVGRRFVHPIHTKRNTGTGARAEGNALPVAGNQVHAAVSAPLRPQYVSVEISGITKRAMASGRGAFGKTEDIEMEGAAKDGKRDQARQFWGTSDGRLADTGTTTAANLIVLDAATTRKEFRDLTEPGQFVDIGSAPATPSSRALEREVIAPVVFTPGGTKTVTVTGAVVTTDANDEIYKSGAAGVSNNTGLFGDGQQELTGLQTSIDSAGVLHTIDPATVAVWSSYEAALGGAAISEDAVDTAIMEGEVRSGKVVKFVVTSDGIFRQYGALLRSKRRYGDKAKLRGGFPGIVLDFTREGEDGPEDVVLTWDSTAPSGSIYGLDPDAFVKPVMGDWEWIDTGGSIWAQVHNSAGRKLDSFEATLTRTFDVVCIQRNVNWKLTGISDPGSV